MATVLLMLLVLFGWWAGREGYISWFGTACTDQGFEPVPSYDDLVSKYGYSPYCARSLRGETWF